MTDLPISGIRVVDLSRVFAMPYAGAYLADLGAEVIKVDCCQAQFVDTQCHAGSALRIRHRHPETPCQRQRYRPGKLYPPGDESFRPGLRQPQSC